MTINLANNNPRIEYTVAQGVVQTVFTVPFEYFEDADVSIYVDGVKKSLGADYTLSGGDGSTGVLTFVAGSPQQVTGGVGGSEVSIVRDVALERTTDFASSGYINRVALNTQLDTIVAQVADLDDRVSRSLHLNDSVVGPDMLLTDARKGKIISFNETTGAVETNQTIADFEIAVTAITVATAQAVISTNGATASVAGAAAALVSKTSAETSETNSASSATAAQTAKTAAELAETNAFFHDVSAATSAINAATSATTASTGASTASTKATEAATSATNSATSATESETAKTAAEAAKDAALAALDSFDDRYLGSKASDPTLDNDGNALVAGALYYNATDNVMKVYTGSVWVAAYASLSGALLTTNNLSDVVNVSSSRTNLGLGTTDSPTFANVTASDVTFSSTNPLISTSGQTGSLTISGDADGVSGANMLLYGSSHATLSDDILFRTNALNVLQYNANTEVWDFQVTDIETTGTVTASGITVDNTNPTIKSADADGFLTLSGGTGTAIGTQIRLYGESHATAANDITFRSGNSAVLIYNASTPVWNFQAEDITTTGVVTTADMNITGPTPVLTITDTSVDGTSQYANVYHASGTTTLDSRNGASNGPIRFRGAGGGVGDEYARFNASGQLLIGTTDTTLYNNTSGGGILLNGSGEIGVANTGNCAYFNRMGSNGDSIRFFNRGGQVGNISTTSSATAYNTSSDYRLKEAWVPMTGASERVQALKPINFAWKVDGSRVDGFLAHELAEVIPEAATGTKDAMKDEEYEVTAAVLDDDGNETSPAVMGTRSVPDYQGIDQSKIVPLLTAALQEALTKIDALETRLTALEEAE